MHHTSIKFKLWHDVIAGQIGDAMYSCEEEPAWTLEGIYALTTLKFSTTWKSIRKGPLSIVRCVC